MQHVIGPLEPTVSSCSLRRWSWALFFFFFFWQHFKMSPERYLRYPVKYCITLRALVWVMVLLVMSLFHLDFRQMFTWWLFFVGSEEVCATETEQTFKTIRISKVSNVDFRYSRCQIYSSFPSPSSNRKDVLWTWLRSVRGGVYCDSSCDLRKEKSIVCCASNRNLRRNLAESKAQYVSFRCS